MGPQTLYTKSSTSFYYLFLQCPTLLVQASALQDISTGNIVFKVGQHSISTTRGPSLCFVCLAYQREFNVEWRMRNVFSLFSLPPHPPSSYKIAQPSRNQKLNKAPISLPPSAPIFHSTKMGHSGRAVQELQIGQTGINRANKDYPVHSEKSSRKWCLH